MTIREFTRHYCDQNDRTAAFSYLGTFAVYFMTLWLALTWPGHWILLLPLVVINGLSGVRLYVLQHDCGHASLFARRWVNDLAGYGLSTFTLTPYRAMQINHNIHHSHLANLDERDSGEIHTMTLSEWRKAGPLTRAAYRLYRTPLFLLPAGGLFTYLIRYRWPKNARRIGVGEIMAQNLFVALWLGLIYWGFGWPGIWIYLSTVLVAGVVGVFLVYLQHNFQDTYLDRKPELSPEKAALVGSSTLDFGWWFDLATGNIAYHDIHHYNARIPSYRLRRCHFDMRKQFEMRTIRFHEAVAAFRLKLWDEETGQLVPFPETSRQPRDVLGAG